MGRCIELYVLILNVYQNRIKLVLKSGNIALISNQSFLFPLVKHDGVFALNMLRGMKGKEI